MNLTQYQGNDLKITLPSGHSVTIREQNGDDDEILSLVNEENKEESIINFNRFLSCIIGANTFNNGSSLTQDEVKKMKLRDKYYILFKSRLHSIGKILKFEAKCPNKDCGKTHNYKEDLTRYDADLANFVKTDFPYQIHPYKTGKETQIEFSIKSGKRLRYTPMNVEAEMVTSKLKTISENTELSCRSLEIKDPGTGEWLLLGSYNVFSKPEMIEIASRVREEDSQFIMLMDLECPDCKKKWVIPFLYSKDFFFPGEI